MALELKFPVLKKIEYIDLIKNKELKLTLKGTEVEGLTWRKFQQLLGQRLPAGNYNYVIKIKGDNKINKGMVKAIGEKIPIENKSNPEYAEISKTILDLNKKVDSISGQGGVSMEMLLNVTKSSYETRITFLNLELVKSNTLYEKQETKIEVLEKELDDADDEIIILKEKTGITQYIEIAKEFMVMKSGKMKPISNLSASEASDIPPEIIEILGVVDWLNVDDKIINEITNGMKMFIQKLPMKEG